MLQPAEWIDTLQALAEPAVAVIDSGSTVPGLRAEVGKARRALREPTEILPALKAQQRAVDPS